MVRSVWDGFDREDDFVVCRPIKISGVWLKVGAPFDKTSVTLRTLRALHGTGEIKRAKHVPCVVLSRSEPAAAPSVQHIGRGRYAVMRGSERVTAEPLTKEQAEAELVGLA